MFTSNSDKIKNKGFMYISKYLVNVEDIQDKNGNVKVIINGNEYMCHNGGNNRISGMSKVSHYFKHLKRFQYGYDISKKAIVINLRSGQADSKVTYGQTWIYEQTEYKAKIDSLLNRLTAFVDDKLEASVLADLKSFKIFTEADLQAHVHRYLAQMVEKADIEGWRVRCNPTLRKSKKPDSLITYQNMPIIVFELKHKIWGYSKHFPKNGLVKDRNKLARYVNRYPTLKKAYLLAVFDEKAEYVYSLRRTKDSSKYKELFINMNAVKGWKTKYIDLRRIL